MGANHIGEIKQLCEIAQPDYGIITNIGKAHIEGFGSYEGVIRAKSEMYDYIASKNSELIVNSDDELLMTLSNGTSRFTYGKSKQADLKARILSAKPYVKIGWSFNGQHHICNSQLFGKFNFYNMLTAIAVGLKFNVPAEQINEAIEQYKPANNRSQQIKTKTNEVILDAYNANPVSMREAILSFKAYAPSNPWIILGDMFELGHISLNEHKNIVDLLIKESFKNVILAGKDFHSLKDTHPFKSFERTDEVIKYLKSNPISQATLLIKGSRGMALERIMPLL
jgi:UDP-N-acetylmuramoyl-tripeptide--D-alanyl-D-alanine ligase